MTPTRHRGTDGQAAGRPTAPTRDRGTDGPAAGRPTAPTRDRGTDGPAGGRPAAPTRDRGTDGQAAAELVALLPLAALLVAATWQLAVAGHAVWSADAAARAAARAAAIGADADAAARGALPGTLARGLRVRTGAEGRVTVTVRIPPVLGLPVLGHASATASFRPQR